MGKGIESDRYRHHERIVTLAIVFLLLHCEVLANGDLSGRFNLTYQKSRTPMSSEEFFFQNYRATLRDKLFRQNDFALTFNLDDSKNLTRNQTLRRFDGRLDLTNHYWALSVLFMPRQKITPLQFEASRETSNNSLNLDVNVPKAPRLRVRYLRVRNYTDGYLQADTRDLRSELSYRYRFVSLRLHRWDTRTENGLEQKTSSTGGEARLVRNLGKWFNVRAGYSHQLTEWRIADPRDVTVQALDGGLTGRYRHYISGTLNFSTRRTRSDARNATQNRQDNNSIFFRVFPASAVSGRLGRRYNLTEGTTRLVSDYGEAQLLMKGDLMKRTTARLTLTKRFDIASDGIAVPPDLAYLSVMSDLYRGVEFRGDLSFSRKNQHDENGRYVVITVLDLFMRLRRNLRVGTWLRRQNVGQTIAFAGSRRTGYGMDITFSGRGSTSMGLSLGRFVTQSIGRREDTTASFTLSTQPTPRTGFTLLYGVDATNRVNGTPGLVPITDQRKTLNAQGTYRITQSGSVAISYNGIGNGGDRSNLAITYRQDF